MPHNEEQRVTPEQVLEVLQTCYDPCCKERAVSVVELGLIQDVKVAENGHDVRVELLLTNSFAMSCSTTYNSYLSCGDNGSIGNPRYDDEVRLLLVGSLVGAKG